MPLSDASKKLNTSPRDCFFNKLYIKFCKDKDLYLLSADTGAPSLDIFFRDFSDRVINVGICEQLMIGMASGLAMGGKKVFCYSIAPFISGRVFDQLKIDICAMNLPVVCLAAGAGYSYNNMGPTHHCVDDISILRVLPNLSIYSVCDSAVAKSLVDEVCNFSSPHYLRFDRQNTNIHLADSVNCDTGFVSYGSGSTCVITSGIMLQNVIDIQKTLMHKHNISIKVIDIFRIKPINEKKLIQQIMDAKNIITIEENLLAGGIGSAVLEILSDNHILKMVTRLGQRDKFVSLNGSREDIWATCELDKQSIIDKIITLYS